MSELPYCCCFEGVIFSLFVSVVGTSVLLMCFQGVIFSPAVSGCQNFPVVAVFLGRHILVRLYPLSELLYC